MASVPVGEIFNWPFIWTLLSGMAIVAILSVLLAHYVFRSSLGGVTLHGLTGVFANTGYMGIPLFLAAFGPDGALPAVIATAVNNAVLLGFTILLIEMDGGEGSSPPRHVPCSPWVCSWSASRSPAGRCPDCRIADGRARLRCGPEVWDFRATLLGGDPCLDGLVCLDRQRVARLVRDRLARQKRLRCLDGID
jgi:predicted permease